MTENRQITVQNGTKKKDITEQQIKTILPTCLDCLKDEQIWVGYDKKKIPLNAHTGFGASSTNPNTWVTYQEAQKAFCNKPDVIGIGVVLGKLHSGYTLCAFDIDHCINENGEISKKALDLIKCINGYTEYSVSGTGIHILFQVADEITINTKNQLKISEFGYTTLENINDENGKFDWCGQLEFYFQKRYIALTGKEYHYDNN